MNSNIYINAPRLTPVDASADDALLIQDVAKFKLFSHMAASMRRAELRGRLNVDYSPNHLGNDGHHMVHITLPIMEVDVELSDYNQYFADRFPIGRHKHFKANYENN